MLFILHQFFHEMTRALTATSGHYSQFTGDGLMALYGLNAADPAHGAADAVRGAREMLTRLDQLNRQLRADLREPLRIGIGIHYGEAIVGAMGPPRSSSCAPTCASRCASASASTTARRSSAPWDRRARRSSPPSAIR